MDDNWDFNMAASSVTIPGMIVIPCTEPTTAAMAGTYPARDPSLNANPAMDPGVNANPARDPRVNANPARDPRVNANPARYPRLNANPAREPRVNVNTARYPRVNANAARYPMAHANPARAPRVNANLATAPLANGNPATASMGRASVAIPQMQFYFYTSKTNLHEIRLFGTIKSSQLLGTDASYGDGVYGTPIPPTRVEEVSALDTWGSYWSQYLEDGQDIDCAIQLQVPTDNLMMSTTNPNVFIHFDCIDVRSYRWQVLELAEGLSKTVQAARAARPQLVIELEWTSSESSDSDSDDQDEQVLPRRATYNPYVMYGSYGRYALEYEETLEYEESDRSSDEG